MIERFLKVNKTRIKPMVWFSEIFLTEIAERNVYQLKSNHISIQLVLHTRILDLNY